MIGLMQITRWRPIATALLAERLTPAERACSMHRSTREYGRMLADLIRRHGDIDIALAAWNAGEGTVRRHGG